MEKKLLGVCLNSANEENQQKKQSLSLCAKAESSKRALRVPAKGTKPSGFGFLAHYFRY